MAASVQSMGTSAVSVSGQTTCRCCLHAKRVVSLRKHARLGGLFARRQQASDCRGGLLQECKSAEHLLFGDSGRFRAASGAHSGGSSAETQGLEAVEGQESADKLARLAALSEIERIKEMQRRKRISNANRGKVPWNKGRKHSPETIAKIKAGTVKAMARPEVRKKLAVFNETQRKPHDEETKAKIRSVLQERSRTTRAIIQKHCQVVLDRMAASDDERLRAAAAIPDALSVLCSVSWSFVKKDFEQILDKWESSPEFRERALSRIESKTRPRRSSSSRERSKVRVAMATFKQLREAQGKLEQAEATVAKLQQVKAALVGDQQRLELALSAEQQALDITEKLRTQVDQLTEAMGPLSQFLSGAEEGVSPQLQSQSPQQQQQQQQGGVGGGGGQGLAAGSPQGPSVAAPSSSHTPQQQQQQQQQQQGELYGMRLQQASEEGSLPESGPSANGSVRFAAPPSASPPLQNGSPQHRAVPGDGAGQGDAWQPGQQHAQRDPSRAAPLQHPLPPLPNGAPRASAGGQPQGGVPGAPRQSAPSAQAAPPEGEESGGGGAWAMASGGGSRRAGCDRGGAAAGASITPQGRVAGGASLRGCAPRPQGGEGQQAQQQLWSGDPSRGALGGGVGSSQLAQHARQQ